jgi:hypothetical protein
MPRLYHVQLSTGPIELYAVSQDAGGGVVTYYLNGPLPNQFMTHPPEFRDISRELCNASPLVISSSGKTAKDNGLALSGEIKSTEEIQHPGSHIMHLSIVWMVVRWEERKPIDGVRAYWLDAISVASIADVVALLQG